MKHIVRATVFLIATSSVCYTQQPLSQPLADAKTTSAYSMLVLRKVTIGADLKEILSEVTSDYPTAKIKQYELNALEREMQEMSTTPESKLPKLSSGYGTLILRRASLKSEIQALLLEHTSGYPIVKRKEAELNLLEDEVRKIME